MKKFPALVKALAREASIASFRCSPVSPTADHYVTIIVRRPQAGVPLGHVQAFAGALGTPWRDARYLADALLWGTGPDSVIERVREFIETGAAA